VYLVPLAGSAESIREPIEATENDPEHETDSYAIDMAHLHLRADTAWNAGVSSKEESEACSEEDFERRLQHPSHFGNDAAVGTSRYTRAERTLGREWRARRDSNSRPPAS